MPPAGFEPKIPGSERPQAQALDRAATGIGLTSLSSKYSRKGIAFQSHNSFGMIDLFRHEFLNGHLITFES